MKAMHVEAILRAGMLVAIILSAAACWYVYHALHGPNR